MRIRFREKTAFEAARCMESSGELHNPGQGWYHVYTFRAKPDGGRPVHSLQAGRLWKRRPGWTRAAGRNSWLWF